MVVLIRFSRDMSTVAPPCGTKVDAGLHIALTQEILPPPTAGLRMTMIFT